MRAKRRHLAASVLLHAAAITGLASMQRGQNNIFHRACSNGNDALKLQAMDGPKGKAQQAREALVSNSREMLEQGSLSVGGFILASECIDSLEAGQFVDHKLASQRYRELVSSFREAVERGKEPEEAAKETSERFPLTGTPDTRMTDAILDRGGSAHQRAHLLFSIAYDSKAIDRDDVWVSYPPVDAPGDVKAIIRSGEERYDLVSGEVTAVVPEGDVGDIIDRYAEEHGVVEGMSRKARRMAGLLFALGGGALALAPFFRSKRRKEDQGEIDREREELIRSALKAREEGSLRLGEFLIRANHLDARERGKGFDLEKALGIYDDHLAGLKRAIAARGSIAKAIPDVLGDFRYKRWRNTLAGALLSKGGNCEGLTHLVAALVYDSGHKDVEIKKFRSHLCPVIIENGKERDLVSGTYAFPGGRRFRADELVDFYKGPVQESFPATLGLLLRLSFSLKRPRWHKMLISYLFWQVREARIWKKIKVKAFWYPWSMDRHPWSEGSYRRYGIGAYTKAHLGGAYPTFKKKRSLWYKLYVAVACISILSIPVSTGILIHKLRSGSLTRTAQTKKVKRIQKIAWSWRKNNGVRPLPPRNEEYERMYKKCLELERTVEAAAKMRNDEQILGYRILAEIAYPTYALDCGEQRIKEGNGISYDEIPVTIEAPAKKKREREGDAIKRIQDTGTALRILDEFSQREDITQYERVELYGIMADLYDLMIKDMEGQGMSNAAASARSRLADIVERGGNIISGWGQESIDGFWSWHDDEKFIRSFPRLVQNGDDIYPVEDPTIWAKWSEKVFNRAHCIDRGKTHYEAGVHLLRLGEHGRRLLLDNMGARREKVLARLLFYKETRKSAMESYRKRPILKRYEVVSTLPEKGILRLDGDKAEVCRAQGVNEHIIRISYPGRIPTFEGQLSEVQHRLQAAGLEREWEIPLIAEMARMRWFHGNYALNKYRMRSSPHNRCEARRTYTEGLMRWAEDMEISSVLDGEPILKESDLKFDYYGEVEFRKNRDDVYETKKALKAVYGLLQMPFDCDPGWDPGEMPKQDEFPELK